MCVCVAHLNDTLINLTKYFLLAPARAKHTNRRRIYINLVRPAVSWCGSALLLLLSPKYLAPQPEKYLVSNTFTPEVNARERRGERALSR